MSKVTFIPNNIKLREISSLCIAKYKNTQSLALSQLTANGTHVFSTTAKEILLLKYDVWFQWILVVEDMLRRKSKDESIADAVMHASDEYAEEYVNIIRGNTDLFDPKYSELWLRSHSFMYSYLRSKILGITSLSDIDFMVKVTDMLIQVMENTLFELHEIDALFRDDYEVHISFDDLCLDYGSVSNESCLMSEKLSIYSEVKDVSNIIVKDYSYGSKLINDKDISKKVSDKLKSHGYNIINII